MDREIITTPNSSESLTNEEERRTGRLLFIKIKAKTVKRLNNELGTPQTQIKYTKKIAGRSRAQPIEVIVTKSLWTVKGVKSESVEMSDEETIQKLGAPAGPPLPEDLARKNVSERILVINGRKAGINIQLFSDGSWLCMCKTPDGKFKPIATLGFRKGQENPPTGESSGQLIATNEDFLQLLTGENAGGITLGETLNNI